MATLEQKAAWRPARVNAAIGATSHPARLWAGVCALVVPRNDDGEASELVHFGRTAGRSSVRTPGRFDTGAGRTPNVGIQARVRRR